MIAEPGGFFQGMTSAVHDLKAAASTGDGFTISEEAGKDLQAAIMRLKAVIREGTNDLSRLPHEAVPMGSSPAAKVCKTFIPTIATDPAQGAIPVFEQMLHDLDDAYETISRSMSSYQHNEQSITARINSIGNDGTPG